MFVQMHALESSTKNERKKGREEERECSNDTLRSLTFPVTSWLMVCGIKGIRGNESH